MLLLLLPLLLLNKLLKAKASHLEVLQKSGN